MSKVKVYRWPEAGICIDKAAIEALRRGCTHMWFNDRMHVVSIKVEDVTGTKPDLDTWMKAAPFDVEVSGW